MTQGSLIAGGGQGASVLEEKPLPEVIEGTDVQESDLVFDNGESEIPNFSNESNKLQELPIEQVVPNPHQPRKVIDPQAVTELAASIESEGLLQPIVVRPAEHGYELIAGEKEGGGHINTWKDQQFLARILEANDLSSASLSLIENLQREELNPIEEAMGYQSLISDFGLSQNEVAQRMGKPFAHCQPHAIASA